MELALNARVILDSPYGFLRDDDGIIVRNGAHGYVRAQSEGGRCKIAFPGIRLDGTYRRATLTLALDDWWIRAATSSEIEQWDSPSIA